MLRMKLPGNEKGMTLLEIMIVLVILGGLIAILATKVTGRLKTARVRQAQLQISEYGKALDMYFTDCNQYPSTEENLQALVAAPSTCPNWGPDPYTKKVNKDPWGGDFIYEIPTSHRQIHDTGKLVTSQRDAASTQNCARNRNPRLHV